MSALEKKEPPSTDTKLYKRRWMMLILFCASNVLNNFHWIEYSVISNLIMKYYRVEAVAVDWLSMSFMLSYSLFFLPATYVIEKKGLRVAVLLGIMGTALGGWIKVFSVDPQRFYVTAIGQAVEAIAEVFLYGVPPYLASGWFGPQEVSFACSIASSSALLGTAVGMIMPPFLVRDNDIPEDIGTDLKTMFYIGSILPTIICILVLCVFENAPPKPPSPAQAAKDNSRNYKQTLINLMTNRPFLLLQLSYALITGVNGTMLTLLNQIILPVFPDHAVDIGWLGTIALLASLIAIFALGIYLDKTHKFREANLLLSLMGLVGYAGFTISIEFEILWMVYVFIIIYGLSTAYFSLGFDYGAELTYPEEVNTMSSIISAASLLFSLIMILLIGWVLRSFGSLAANGVCCAFLAASVGICVFTKGELKRCKAQKENSQTVQKFPFSSLHI